MTSYIKASTELTLIIGSIFPFFMIIFYFVVLKQPEKSENNVLLEKDLDPNEEISSLCSNSNLVSNYQSNNKNSENNSDLTLAPLSFKQKFLHLPVNK
jgi:hypothetical protein